MRHVVLTLKFLKNIYNVTEVWHVQYFFCDFQRDITQELRKWEQSFLSGTVGLALIYISIKYHEDILKIVYGQTDSAML